MYDDITLYKGWQKINRLYYGRFKHILVIYTDNRNDVEDEYYRTTGVKPTPDNINNGHDVKFRRTFIGDKYETRVYTNDQQLIDLLISAFGEKIVKIYSPASQEHSDLLDQTGVENNTIIRDKLYYNKYHYKFSFDSLNARGWIFDYKKREYMSSEINRLQKWITENMTDTKCMDNKFSWFGAKNYYTADEASLIMLRMITPEEVKMQVTKVLVFTDS